MSADGSFFFALFFSCTKMNTDQEQEVIRIGKKLEKITHNDLSVDCSLFLDYCSKGVL